MKTPEEWLISDGILLQNDHTDSHPEIAYDFIRRIQQDAHPKWVTGEEAKKWPDDTLVLCQSNTEFIPMTIGQIKNFKASVGLPIFRFLRLDDLLGQPWPKE